MRSPLLLYMGSKWRIADKILPLIPPHEVFVEVYGGSGALIAKKTPALDVWNDLDGELVNLFQVMRSNDADRLIQVVALTPFSRAEYDAAFAPTVDPVERARRLVVRLQMGRGTNTAGLARKPGWRVDKPAAGANLAARWAKYPDNLAAAIARFRLVAIESCDAMDLIARWNSPRAVLYLDPPYLPETRAANAYPHEMSIDDHKAMLDAAVESRAMVIISGYASPLYDSKLCGWSRTVISARTLDNIAREEVVWRNEATTTAMGLFSHG